MKYTDICPAVLAEDQAAYEQQITNVVPFATRVHIDIVDGTFAPNQTVGASDVWWPGGMRADIHVMYERPHEIIDTLIALDPQLVIVHAEAQGDFMSFAKKMHYNGIEAGVALLPQTPVEIIRSAIDHIDHVLIFSGDLGKYGGQANLDLLQKVKDIRALTMRAEISWDGGVNVDNARVLAEAGVEVLISGGFIQKAENPAQAYQSLKATLLDK